MEEETNIIPLLEKANKYIIILNKSIIEGISKLKELYSLYFPELPTIGHGSGKWSADPDVRTWSWSGSPDHAPIINLEDMKLIYFLLN